MTHDPNSPFSKPGSGSDGADVEPQFVLNQGDAFSMNQDFSVTPSEKGQPDGFVENTDPFARHTPTGLPGGGGNARTSAVVATILVAGIIAFAGLGLAGWWVWTSVDGTGTAEPVVSDSDIDEPYSPGDDWDPDYLTADMPDFESWDAVPGDTFVFGGSQNVRVGVDLESGFYTAPADGVCSWRVRSRTDLGPEAYYSSGHVNGGDALVVLPRGYLFEAHGCGTWTAIDPVDVLQGPNGEVVQEGVSYVGRDIAPGSYLIPPAVGSHNCFAAVSGTWGFIGPGFDIPMYWGGSGTVIFDVEPGHTVTLSGCPDATLVDAEELVSRDQGATSITDGTWLVGVDVRSGTYVGSDEFSDTVNVCSLGVWGDSLTYQGDETKAWHEYGPNSAPIEVTLEPGDTVESVGCGTWTRTGS